MKNILILFLILFCSKCYAFTETTLQDSKGNSFGTSSNPIHISCLSGCSGGGSGTVTSVSVASANGFAGTVATATTTPAITISTSITGILKGNGTSVSAASAGTDYAPATSGSGMLFGNGSGGTTGATTTAVSGGNIGIGTTSSLNGLLEVFGNVGISTGNPGQKLDIQGTARMTGFNLSTTPSSGYVLTSDGSGNGTWQPSSGSSQWVGTAGNPITYAQNVGIGTVTAGKQLTVGSTGQFTVDSSGVVNSPQATFTSTSSGTPAVAFQGASTGIAATFNVNGAGSVAAQFSSGDMIISETVGSRNSLIGNVGIGSSNPGAALDLGTSGKFVAHSSTGLGWSEHNATNQACNTTCGTSACVIGLDIGTVGIVNSGFVACTDATADDCLCAGP